MHDAMRCCRRVIREAEIVRLQLDYIARKDLVLHSDYYDAYFQPIDMDAARMKLVDRVQREGRDVSALSRLLDSPIALYVSIQQQVGGYMVVGKVK